MNYNEHINQEYVDEYLEETEMLAGDVDCEEKAIVLLKRISYLRSISDEYFVPDLIEEWKQMAMKHIDSPRTYFRKVHYDLIMKNHQEFFESIEILEGDVINGYLSEEEIFELVRSFNINLETTNESCEKYGTEKLAKYRFKSDMLQKHYDKWLM